MPSLNIEDPAPELVAQRHVLPNSQTTPCAAGEAELGSQRNMARTLDSLVAQFPIGDLVQMLAQRLAQQLQDASLEIQQLRVSLKSNAQIQSVPLQPLTDWSNDPTLTIGKGSLQSMTGSDERQDGNGNEHAAVENKASKLSRSRTFKEPTPDELQQIKDVFARFDKDNSSQIDLAELQTVLEGLGKRVTKKQAKAGMKEMDRNGDMTCSFDEFVQWYMSQPNLGGLLDPQAVRDAVKDAASMVEAEDEDELDIGARASKRTRQVFADADKMKKIVRKSILSRTVEDTSHYHDTSEASIRGRLAIIATSQYFDITMFVVIGVNALWMSFDTDLTDGATLLDKHIAFQLAEFGFFAFFLGEWLIKFGALRNKLYCVTERWFCFDTILLILMVVDMLLPLVMQGGTAGNTSILRLFRLVKLARMGRVARLLRAIPELGILLKGITVASRSVSSTLCLLLLLVYVFSMCFRQLTNDTDVGREYFSSVPHGMKALILESAIPDNSDWINALADQNPLLGMLGLLFLIFSAMTLMNMLIGVLCEVIGVVSCVEKESVKVHFVKGEILNAMKQAQMVVTDHLIIDKEDFQKLLMNPITAKAIRGVGVDPVGLVDFCDFIFSGHCCMLSKSDVKEGLRFSHFVHLIMEMGDTNTCRVKDVIDLRKFLMTRFDRIEKSIAQQISSLHPELAPGKSRKSHGACG